MAVWPMTAVHYFALNGRIYLPFYIYLLIYLFFVTLLYLKKSKKAKPKAIKINSSLKTKQKNRMAVWPMTAVHYFALNGRIYLPFYIYLLIYLLFITLLYLKKSKKAKRKAIKINSSLKTKQKNRMAVWPMNAVHYFALNGRIYLPFYIYLLIYLLFITLLYLKKSKKAKRKAIKINSSLKTKQNKKIEWQCGL